MLLCNLLTLTWCRQGASLALASRNQQRLEQLTEECILLGSAFASPVVYDASAAAQSDLLIANTVKLLGGLDILILDHVAPPHSGNYMVTGSATKLLREIAEVDLYSYVTLAQHALEHFQQRYKVRTCCWPCWL